MSSTTVLIKQKQGLVQGLVKKRLIEMAMAPKVADKMVLVMCNALARTPKLAECTEPSLIDAFLKAGEFELEPNTPLGLCHVIPYGNQAQFQLGYQGVEELAYRSGRVTNIYAVAVRENDDFKIELGLRRILEHVPATSSRGKVIGYYAVAQIKDGDPAFDYMTVEEVTEHMQKYSKAHNQKNSAWQTAFDEMAKKTVVIRALKHAPKSVSDKVIAAAKADDDNVLIDGNGKRTIDVTPPDSLDALAETVNNETGEIEKPDPEEEAMAVEALRAEIEAMVKEANLSPKIWDEILASAGSLDGTLDNLGGGQLEVVRKQLSEVQGQRRGGNNERP